MVTRVAYPLYISQLSHTRRIEVTARVGDAIGGLALSEPRTMDSSALNTKRAWRPKGLAGLRLHNPLAGPGGPAGRATTPAAAPPNPSGPWRAGRKGLTFASDADRDRYEKGRSGRRSVRRGRPVRRRSVRRGATGGHTARGLDWRPPGTDPWTAGYRSRLTGLRLRSRGPR